jgi:acetoin utilization protein AcuB
LNATHSNVAAFSTRAAKNGKMKPRRSRRTADTEPLLVVDLMSERPAMVDAGLEAHAAARFARARGVHHLLVVRDEELVGVVCLCDVESAQASTRLGTLLGAPVVVVDSSATAEACAELMRDHGVGCLPVGDSLGALVGIVTRRDLREAGLLPLERGIDLCSSCGTGHHLRAHPGSDGSVFCAACLEETPGPNSIDGLYRTLGGSG